jgi:hypothetical protein
MRFANWREIFEARFSGSKPGASQIWLEEQLPRNPALALTPLSISLLKRFEVKYIAVGPLLDGNVEALEIVAGQGNANGMGKPGHEHDCRSDNGQADAFHAVSSKTRFVAIHR